MNTYTVMLRSDAEFAYLDVQAKTPEQALAIARKTYEHDPYGLSLEPYDQTQPVNEIAVCNEDGKELAVWFDEHLRLRLAAQDLLDALRFCDMALADLEASKRKGYLQEASRLARAAIALATGGAK